MKSATCIHQKNGKKKGSSKDFHGIWCGSWIPSGMEEELQDKSSWNGLQRSWRSRDANEARWHRGFSTIQAGTSVWKCTWMICMDAGLKETWGNSWSIFTSRWRWKAKCMDQVKSSPIWRGWGALTTKATCISGQIQSTFRQPEISSELEDADLQTPLPSQGGLQARSGRRRYHLTRRMLRSTDLWQVFWCTWVLTDQMLNLQFESWRKAWKHHWVRTCQNWSVWWGTFTGLLTLEWSSAQEIQMCSMSTQTRIGQTARRAGLARHVRPLWPTTVCWEVTAEGLAWFV